MQYHHSFKNSKVFEPKGNFLSFQVNINGGKLGEATGAMARLVFWSRGLKKSRKVLKSKSRSLEWHQLFLPSFGADGHIYSRALGIFNFATIGAKILKLCEIIAVHFLRSNSKLILSPCDKETNAGFSL